MPPLDQSQWEAYLALLLSVPDTSLEACCRLSRKGSTRGFLLVNIDTLRQALADAVPAAAALPPWLASRYGFGERLARRLLEQRAPQFEGLFRATDKYLGFRMGGGAAAPPPGPAIRALLSGRLCEAGAGGNEGVAAALPDPEWGAYLSLLAGVPDAELLACCHVQTQCPGPVPRRLAVRCQALRGALIAAAAGGAARAPPGGVQLGLRRDDLGTRLGRLLAARGAPQFLGVKRTTVAGAKGASGLTYFTFAWGANGAPSAAAARALLSAGALRRGPGAAAAAAAGGHGRAAAVSSGGAAMACGSGGSCSETSRDSGDGSESGGDMSSDESGSGGGGSGACDGGGRSGDGGRCDRGRRRRGRGGAAPAPPQGFIWRVVRRQLVNFAFAASWPTSLLCLC